MKIDINQFKPDEENREYFKTKPSFEEAWNGCERGDWMLWVASKLGVDDRLLIKAQALCANTVRRLMKDSRSGDAVDAALMYAEGRISRKKLNRAASAAADAMLEMQLKERMRKGMQVTTWAKVFFITYYANYAAYAAAADNNGTDIFASAAAAAAAIAAADDAVAHFKALTHDDTLQIYNAAEKVNHLQTGYICLEVLTDAVFEKVKQLKIKQSKNKQI
jgi:hypothetical protein